MSPIEAFKRAMFYVSGLCSSRTANKPGAVIERLSPEARESLKGLKSDEIGPDVRLDDVKYFAGTDEFWWGKEYQKDRLEFDKKILKK